MAAERAPAVALVDLGAALVAGALWYVRPELGPLPLLLLAIGFVVRHFSDPPVEYELTALDAAVALFLVSAGIGLLIAYDWNVALEKFYVILGGVGIYGALVRVPWEIDLAGRAVKPVNLLLGVLPTAIAAYYVATADYSLQIGKLPFLDGVFQWIASWQPSLPGHKLHPNVAGGLIAALLPLQVLALAELAGTEIFAPGRTQGLSPHGGSAAGHGAKVPGFANQPAYRLGWRGSGIETVLVVISLLGLVLTASRGAWAALVLVTAVWALVSRIWPAQAGSAGGRLAAGMMGLLVVLLVAGLVAAPEAWAHAARDVGVGAGLAPAPAARDVVVGAGLAPAPELAHYAGQPGDREGRPYNQDDRGARAASFDYAPSGRSAQDANTQDGQDAEPPRGLGVVDGRAELLRDSLALAWDTAFTGIGLGGFQMAFSSYILLLHVGHTFHSHNLFLNVWLEQGLLGLFALVWLLGAALVAWRRVRRLGDRQDKAWAAAALAAIAVIVVHGMVDDAFYGSRGVLLLFVPFALLTRVQGDAVWSAYEPPTLTEVLLSRNGFIAAALLAFALLLGLTPPVRSQFQANLGSLSQTRAELSVYEWPTWPIQDALRRDTGAAGVANSPGGAPTLPGATPGIATAGGPVDLGAAIAHYKRALAIDPKNEVANRRLGQIALSQGDYPTAASLLSAAYYNDYTNRAARQLYGEILALEGQTEKAAAVWRTVDVSSGQLDARIWWYESIGEMEKAAAIRAARG